MYRISWQANVELDKRIRSQKWDVERNTSRGECRVRSQSKEE